MKSLRYPGRLGTNFCGLEAGGICSGGIFARSFEAIHERAINPPITIATTSSFHRLSESRSLMTTIICSAGPSVKPGTSKGGLTLGLNRRKKKRRGYFSGKGRELRPRRCAASAITFLPGGSTATGGNVTAIATTWPTLDDPELQGLPPPRPSTGGLLRGRTWFSSLEAIHERATSPPMTRAKIKSLKRSSKCSSLMTNIIGEK